MQVGLMGTGYAAKLRAEALQADPRATLVAIAGQDPERTQEFSQRYGAIACESWQALLAIAEIDLVIVSTVNQLHGAIVRAALETGKHVVVEYPLCLDAIEGETLLQLAKTQNKLLHVEHIELLGGVHQAFKAALPQVGAVFAARYVTLKPEHPAPERWSYHGEQFGFPLMGALSRLHRLVDVFGSVATVTCTAQYGITQADQQTTTPHLPAGYYHTCLCTAQLRFKSGVLAEVTYGKGAALWQATRLLTVQGAAGALVFDGDQGSFITPADSQPVPVGGRRGLFVKDTTMVLDHLRSGAPLYLTPEASLYTLQIAAAAHRSAEQDGTPIAIA